MQQQTNRMHRRHSSRPDIRFDNSSRLGYAMEDSEDWTLVDTETTGLSQPIYVVEIAAQKMRGWKPVGEPFRKLINAGADIQPEVSRVNGYTKEILERDGYPPVEVYDEFADYADGAPICSYNIKYDYDDVLINEWKRNDIKQITPRGFCLLRLAQRLLDPIQAGNHKLQTLRQFYRLPERGAHTALGDVLTVVDLLETVLQPLGALKGLTDMKSVRSFTEEKWFPTKLPFGKFRGRSFLEARENPNLKSWIEWLAQSDNERSREMGSWYLEKLSKPRQESVSGPKVIATAVDSTHPSANRGSERKGIIVFDDTRVSQLKALVNAARERLADLESVLDRDRIGVAQTQSKLFGLLRPLYQKRDALKLLIKFRKKYINSILDEFDIDPDEIESEYHKSQKKLDDEYKSAQKESEATLSLSESQQNELKNLHRELVKLYHPDRVFGDDDTAHAYSELMSIINDARRRMDIDLMREIAENPEAFMQKNNLGSHIFDDNDELHSLQRLYESLQERILDTISAIADLRASPPYQVFRFSMRREDYLSEVADLQRTELEMECEKLEIEADQLKSEIEKLTGAEAF